MSRNGGDSSTSEVVDVHGFTFHCSPDQQQDRKLCAQRQKAQTAAWEKYVKRKTLPKEDKLKKLCRKGIPLDVRPWAWMAMSGAATRKAGHMAGYFDAMLQNGEVSSECAHQIELDLPRTFPGNRWMSTEEGQAALGRVLLAFSVHKPDIGYCQSMNYIAALLLLAMEKDEEAAFWVLVSLIDDGGILYRDMYTSNLVGAHVEMRSLEDLVAKKLPRLSAHLCKLHCDMTIIATDWFLCLFSTALPSETATRVWDSLLFEGTKILFRVSLALLKLHEEQLLQMDNAGDLINQLRMYTTHIHDRDRLMKVAFDGVGSMPMQRIRDVREVKQAVVDTEMERRERRQELRRSLSVPRVSSTDSVPLPSEGLAGFAERLGLRNIAWKHAPSTNGI